MRLLIIYHQKPRAQRMAISSHLLSFEKYKGEHFVQYWNIAYGIPELIDKCGFDAIVFHFTFFLPNINSSFESSFSKWGPLKKCNLPKFAMIQDEYVNTLSLCHFLKEFGVCHVFTCLPSSLWQTVYPNAKSGVTDFTQVLTGYIDEQMLANYGSRHIPHNRRTIDIGYRARKVPFNLGKHGTYKWLLTEKILDSSTTLRLDVSNDPNEFIFGQSWFDFVQQCRIMPGCEGGTSLHDPDGKLRTKVNEFVLNHPSANFEETEQECFRNQDLKFPYYALSPRHFEAAISKTCQILIEGEYNGVFVAGKHYIPIKKDWSNLKEVLTLCENIEYCEQIAENTYRDIAMNKSYSYSYFVQEVFNVIQTKIQAKNGLNAEEIANSNKLQHYHINPFQFAPFLVLKNLSIEWTKQIIFKFGIDKAKWFKWIELKLIGSNSVR